MLADLLARIEEERILVIESGCYGTFPMLLMSLDSRVDFRMFTTVPYLSGIYQGRIFTRAYEKNRLFETLYSQDLLIRFAGYEDGKFLVAACEDPAVAKRAYAEINSMRRY